MHDRSVMRIAIRPSLRSIYRREVDRGFARIARAGDTGVVTEADLARHHPLVQRYLRRVGVVGKPRTHAMRARFAAEMKMAPDADWMHADADQTSFFDEPTRLFIMSAKRGGIPFSGLHVYAGAHATFEVRLASFLRIVDARGPEMDKSETVTMFNDLCVFAVPALVFADVRWEDIDATHVRGIFTNAGHTVSAELAFDDAGDLVSWVSNDRSMTADGKTYENYPWVTPLYGYRDYHGYRLASGGDAIWKRPQGDFAYGRFRLVDVTFDSVADERAVVRDDLLGGGVASVIGDPRVA